MSRWLARASLIPTGGGWSSVGRHAFQVGPEGSGSIFETPAGTFTNLADVPRLLWPILPRDDPRFIDAILQHDYHCREVARGDMSRKLKDALFWEAMKTARAPAWRRRAYYQGVRFWALLRAVGLRG
jgi:hypothetical protein